MTDTDEQFTELFGGAAKYSDFRSGEAIHYRADGHIWTGLIVWVAAPSESHIENRDPLKLRYVVERDGWENSFPDIVYSSDILSEP